jgi:hypothetical protein
MNRQLYCEPDLGPEKPIAVVVLMNTFYHVLLSQNYFKIHLKTILKYRNKCTSLVQLGFSKHSTVR